MWHLAGKTLIVVSQLQISVDMCNILSNILSKQILHLFGTFVLIDCVVIFVDAFDREYRLAFSQLGHRDLARLRVYDRPPNNAITWCRRIFSDLEL